MTANTSNPDNPFVPTLPRASFSRLSVYKQCPLQYKFKYLDKKCWNKYRQDELAPYLRKGKKIQSYASTLGIIFNGEDAVNYLKVDNYLQYQDYKKMSIKRFIERKIIAVFRKIKNYLEYFVCRIKNEGK